MAEIEPAEHCPCLSCTHADQCKTETVACLGYVRYSQTGKSSSPTWPATRLHYLMAHADLKMSLAQCELGNLLREYRAEHQRRPTLREAMDKLALDARATLELAERYRAKQSMTGAIFYDV